MKKIWGLILFIFLMCNTNCYASRFNFLVLPNDLLTTSSTTMVYQKSATLIGNDIINYYNQQPDMSATQIGQIKTYLDRPENYRLRKEVKAMLSDYEKSYLINFATLQKLASKFGVKQVLLITCNMDAQNYVLRRTLWDALDIPGATVVDPAYRLTTQINLVDVNNQMVLWQHNYQKLISSRESRMITPVYGDNNEQLEKIKKYSTKFLAPQVVQETQLALYQMSPYQDLNLHPEIVKPEYVSIDKIKIDSKRAGVRSARYAKNQSILAGQIVAAESVKLAKKSKRHLMKFKDKMTDKAEQQRLLMEQQNAMSVEDRIKQIQDEQATKLELQKEKQKLKFEKQQMNAQLKAAKQKAKMEAKMELQKEKQKLIQQNQPQQPVVTESIEQVQFVEQPAKKQKTKKTKEQKQKEVEVRYPVTPEMIPPQKLFQQDYKPAPYIRTKTNLRDKDYTINDY